METHFLSKILRKGDKDKSSGQKEQVHMSKTELMSNYYMSSLQVSDVNSWRILLFIKGQEVNIYVYGKNNISFQRYKYKKFSPQMEITTKDW